MNYTETAPSKHLARYVKCFWTLEQSNTEAQTAPEPVMPDGCIEVVFNLADRFRRYHADGSVEVQSSMIVAGQMRQSSLIEPSGSVKLFGIRFHSAGAYPFFKFPLSELTDRIENLDLIWGREAAIIEERIAGSRTTEEMIADVENFLTELLAANRSFDPYIEEAARLIVSGEGLTSIDSVTKHLGISGRRLERRFQQRFGISPKLFSRITRFQNLMAALQYGPKEGLLGTALSFGYYDQAHLIHEFKQFSGQSPVAYFQSEYQFSQFFVNSAK